MGVWADPTRSWCFNLIRRPSPSHTSPRFSCFLFYGSPGTREEETTFLGAESFDLCTVFMFKTPMTFTSGKRDHHKAEAGHLTFQRADKGPLSKVLNPQKLRAPLGGQLTD